MFAKQICAEALQEPSRLSPVKCPEPIGESATWLVAKRMKKPK